MTSKNIDWIFWKYFGTTCIECLSLEIAKQIAFTSFWEKSEASAKIACWEKALTFLILKQEITVEIESTDDITI